MNTPKKFDEIGEFSEGLGAFIQGDKFGFVDRQGEIVKEEYFVEGKTIFVSELSNNYCRPVYIADKLRFISDRLNEKTA